MLPRLYKVYLWKSSRTRLIYRLYRGVNKSPLDSTKLYIRDNEGINGMLAGMETGRILLIVIDDQPAQQRSQGNFYTDMTGLSEMELGISDK